MGRESRLVKLRTNELTEEQFWATAEGIKEEAGLSERVHKLGLIMPSQNTPNIELADSSHELLRRRL